MKTIYMKTKKNILAVAVFISAAHVSFSQSDILQTPGPLTFIADNDNTGDREYKFYATPLQSVLKIKPATVSGFQDGLESWDRYTFRSKVMFNFQLLTTDNRMLVLNFHHNLDPTINTGKKIIITESGIDMRLIYGEYSNWGPMVLRADSDNTGDGDFVFKGSNNIVTAKIDAAGNPTFFGGNLNLFNSPTLLATANKLQIFCPNGSIQQGMTLTQTGLGIGVENPTEKLVVGGRVKAQSFIATTTRFPDYVFAKDYDLRSLEETQLFVTTHLHLPNMPSEKNVLENGMDLKEITTISVEKIEELYLHLFELNERIKQLENELKTTQAQIAH